jgi:Ca2+-binding EF-hand superfamily protein
MLTPFQQRKLTRYFNCLDVDGNGFFEKEDVDIIVDRLTSKRGLEKGSDEFKYINNSISLIWENARKFGISKDPDRVTLADWLAHEDLILDNEETREGYMKKITKDVFDLIDADGNGEIDIDEFNDIMTSFGVAEGIPQWSFQHLDLDGNGTISKDEFVTIVEDFHLSEDLDAPGNYLFGPY